MRHRRSFLALSETTFFPLSVCFDSRASVAITATPSAAAPMTYVMATPAPASLPPRVEHARHQSPEIPPPVREPPQDLGPLIEEQFGRAQLAAFDGGEGPRVHAHALPNRAEVL